MSIQITPLHDDLAFLSPLSVERADRLCRFVAQTADEGTIADVGCGWAPMLVRLLEMNGALHGIGIDLDADLIYHGQAMAHAAGVDDRIELVAADAKDHLPAEVEGVLCVGAAQIWGPPPDLVQPLDYRRALDALRSAVRPGAPVVFGDSIWSATPTAAAIAPLAGRIDEFVVLADLLDIARSAGFEIVASHQATLDEWDRFESGFTAGWVRWLATHPADHPDAADVRDRLVAQSNAYHRGYRGVLGMAYLEMVAV